MSRHRLLLSWVALIAACGGSPANLPDPTAPGSGAQAAPAPASAITPEVSPATTPEVSPATTPEVSPAKSPELTPPISAATFPELHKRPAPPAPGLSGLPTSHLAPWPHKLGFEGRVGMVRLDDRLVIISEDKITAVFGDGKTPTRMRERRGTTGYQPMFSDDTLTMPPVAQGVALFRSNDGVLTAYDLESLMLLWSFDLPRLRRGSEIHLSSGNAFIVVTGKQILAMDPKSGTELWRKSYRSRASHQRWRAGLGLFFMHDSELKAYDARNGDLRWESPGLPYDARLYDVVGGTLPVLSDESKLVLLHAEDGTVQKRIRLKGAFRNGRNLTIHKGVLYVARARKAKYEEVDVRAYDLKSGRSLWKAGPFHAEWNAYHPSLGLDDELLYLCTNRWTALGIDKASGKTRLVVHPSACDNPNAWRPRPGAPQVVFFANHPGSAYERAAKEANRHPATVSGKVSCQGVPAARAEVWIGHKRTHTNASGRYRVQIQVGATVPVYVDQVNLRGSKSFCVGENRTLSTTGKRVKEDFVLKPGGGRGLR